MIPEYSLTGDLLSFLTCNLQYRYQNKGTLPPSMPVQLWFGEFIHGVMEEAYIKWDLEHKKFPWDWKKDIRPIENMIDLRLQVRGLYPPLDHFYSTNTPGNTLKIEDLTEEHKKLASARAEKAINTLGPDLFPLIDSAEVLIKGIRDIPNYDKNRSRSNYYGINGVIDVLSSLKINETFKNKAPALDNYKNRIIEYLKRDDTFQKTVQKLNEEEYEIIIDYKGMKRPSCDSPNWIHHAWQILTYSWLRSKQEESKPVVAGIVFYLNELVPSTEDLVAIQQDISAKNTDVKISSSDYNKLMNWDEDMDFPHLSEKFKKDRSIRIITIDQNNIDSALKEFDKVVNKIENSLIKEMDGCKIKDAWNADADERTCRACDFKTFCNKKNKIEEFKVP